jgi:uncharacterized membrane protein YsdA (DUF1294 family)
MDILQYEYFKYILYYLISINIITFLIYGIDKYKSINQKYRISEKALLLFGAIGGLVGAIIAMLIFRHKLKKTSYMMKFLSIIVIEVSVIFIYKNYF